MIAAEQEEPTFFEDRPISILTGLVFPGTRRPSHAWTSAFSTSFPIRVGRHGSWPTRNENRFHIERSHA